MNHHTLLVLELGNSGWELRQGDQNGFFESASGYPLGFVPAVQVLNILEFLDLVKLDDLRFPGLSLPISHREGVVALDVEVPNSEQSLGYVLPLACLGEEDVFCFRGGQDVGQPASGGSLRSQPEDVLASDN